LRYLSAHRRLNERLLAAIAVRKEAGRFPPITPIGGFRTERRLLGAPSINRTTEIERLPDGLQCSYPSCILCQE